MTVNKPDFLRHNMFISPDVVGEKQVCIIGCGATGSHLAMVLAELGFKNFILFDKDVVEAHNLPNQAFSARHIGMPKVHALANILIEFNPDIEVTPYEHFFYSKDHTDLLEDILVLTTDSMSSRKDIYEAFVDNALIDLVLETRVGFNQGQIYHIDPMNSKECKAWYDGLFSDEEAEPSPCNARIIPTLVRIVSAAAGERIASFYSLMDQGSYEPSRMTIIDRNKDFEFDNIRY